MHIHPSASQMVTLLDGRVLVIAGYFEFIGLLNTAELFDPATSTFLGTGSLQVARYKHRASLLPGGKVLVTGGFEFCQCPCNGYLNSSEIYDPATGNWTLGPSMPYDLANHDQITLPTGQVLITGSGGDLHFCAACSCAHHLHPQKYPGCGMHQRAGRHCASRAMWIMQALRQTPPPMPPPACCTMNARTRERVCDGFHGGGGGSQSYPPSMGVLYRK